MKTELSRVEMNALAGYTILNDVDAAYMCVNNDSKADEKTFHKMALRWLRDERCKAFIESQRVLLQDKARKELADKAKKNMDSKDDLTDKSNVIKELQILYRSEHNAKAKSDILMKIADLERMKQEKPVQEEDRVHYYMPHSECEKCPHAHLLIAEDDDEDIS
jgi:hypothetical protein